MAEAKSATSQRRFPASAAREAGSSNASA